jgi:hypothetical protein
MVAENIVLDADEIEQIAVMADALGHAELVETLNDDLVNTMNSLVVAVGLRPAILSLHRVASAFVKHEVHANLVHSAYEGFRELNEMTL